MDRNEELINKRYDALMFASNPEQAKRAAKSLVELVLGEEGVQLPLEAAMVEVCRKVRPASDARDQARFEAEFLELVFSPTGQGVASVATAVSKQQSSGELSQSLPISRRKAA